MAVWAAMVGQQQVGWLVCKQRRQHLLVLPPSKQQLEHLPALLPVPSRSARRPCPLAQQYIGVTVKKPLQRFQLMNEICYTKVSGTGGSAQEAIMVSMAACLQADCWQSADSWLPNRPFPTAAGHGGGWQAPGAHLCAQPQGDRQDGAVSRTAASFRLCLRQPGMAWFGSNAPASSRPSTAAADLYSHPPRCLALASPTDTHMPSPHLPPLQLPEGGMPEERHAGQDPARRLRIPRDPAGER